MSPSATPATQSEGRCHQVPRLPRESEGRCHQAPRLPRESEGSMSPRATPATQSDGRCRQVPRLLRNSAATTAANGNQARHQSQPSASKCHACHAK